MKNNFTKSYSYYNENITKCNKQRKKSSTIFDLWQISIRNLIRSFVETSQSSSSQGRLTNSSVNKWKDNGGARLTLYPTLYITLLLFI